MALLPAGPHILLNAAARTDWGRPFSQWRSPVPYPTQSPAHRVLQPWVWTREDSSSYCAHHTILVMTRRRNFWTTQNLVFVLSGRSVWKICSPSLFTHLHKPSRQHCCSQTVLYRLSTNHHCCSQTHFFTVWAQTFVLTLLQSDPFLYCLSTNLCVNTAAVRPISLLSEHKPSC